MIDSKIHVPPIKSQGIKTKLVPWIRSVVPDRFSGRWIEPFMGTGVVAFNIAPKSALLCDTNPHLINFYQSIADDKTNPKIVREFLAFEGERLLAKGEDHYYAIRDRFNAQHAPLDFLFLNRAGFNGMIRFNRTGGFNVPFCRKPHRFTQSYITKIVNQVEYVHYLFRVREFEFKLQNFGMTIDEASPDDIIYCDPPYIARHVDYHNGWGESQEHELFDRLLAIRGGFVLSTWHHNDYRENEYVRDLWSQFNVLTREHFYHVGAKEVNRNPMIEALITNFDVNGHTEEQAIAQRATTATTTQAIANHQQAFEWF